MKAILYILLSICLFAGCTGKSSGPGAVTTLCIIGTAHDSSAYINPQAIYVALEQVRPDVILCELEREFFTDDFRYDLEKYPDLLSTNENISTYRYQQQNRTLLRPYEIEGRNEYYRTTDYFEKEQEMFSAMMQAYRDTTLTPASGDEWERFLKTVELFDVMARNSLREINTELYVRYSESKNLIVNETLTSVARRDFPEWLDAAVEHQAFWDRRNAAMAENILAWCSEFPGKTLVVLAGQQHKYQLENLIRQNGHNIVLKQYWEFGTAPDASALGMIGAFRTRND